MNQNFFEVLSRNGNQKKGLLLTRAPTVSSAFREEVKAHYSL
jgi:hypothetical protein